MVELARTYPMPPHVVALRFLLTILARTAIVCGVISLVVLVFGIAVEEGALGLDYDVAQGIDAYLRSFMGIVALGGGFGLGLLAAIAHDIYRREQRKVLNRVVEDGAGRRNEIPVDWQRRAISESRLGSMILSGFAAVLGPIVVISGIVMVVGDDDVPFALGALAVGAVMSWVGIVGLRAAFRDKGGAAQELWAKKLPPLHPNEPARRYDSDGNLQKVGARELAATAEAKSALAAAPEAVRRLAGLDRLAGIVMNLSLGLFLASGLITTGIVLLRQPCRECDPRTFDVGVEALIDSALLLTSVLTIIGVGVLVAATVVEVLVTLRLRRTFLELAADPDSPAPPWYLLRRLLLEEAPMQSLTGHLHTVGVLCLALGLTGLVTSDVYPFSDWTRLYPLLCTVGGILLLFHASGWFWQRDRTLRENDSLRERWNHRARTGA
ncbi:hypothetical protein LKO27_09415 [Tessaracoccus sp. OS52]|uniref:hypothetical protein n=1 Tax=Tessaracoccus sp. OS52 TaxID=2886691 RepID=UPI001D12C708|nr:hypothetical protein [Tessaracoccus sp. OS52]MCC2593623.1 hypothetical protein [Tessaracoccus sp. OS52]